MARILTAVFLIPIVVSLVLWAPVPLLLAVQLAITELALWEFFRLAEASGAHPLKIPGYVFGAGIAVLSPNGPVAVWMLGVVIFLLMVLLASALFSLADLTVFLPSVSSTLLGVLYVALPLNLLISVCIQPSGRHLVLFGLVVVWVGDTMAFFVGSRWGRHKLAPRISPGKTWEGTAASLAAAILVGLVFAHYFPIQTGFAISGSEGLIGPGAVPTETMVGLWGTLLLSAIINVAAQIGDLAESAIKRNAQAKDSSHLVPGHGGVLDRIDALLFAAPVLWYYYFAGVFIR